MPNSPYQLPSLSRSTAVAAHGTTRPTRTIAVAHAQPGTAPRRAVSVTGGNVKRLPAAPTPAPFSWQKAAAKVVGSPTGKVSTAAKAGGMRADYVTAGSKVQWSPQTPMISVSGELARFRDALEKAGYYEVSVSSKFNWTLSGGQTSLYISARTPIDRASITDIRGDWQEIAKQVGLNFHDDANNRIAFVEKVPAGTKLESNDYTKVGRQSSGSAGSGSDLFGELFNPIALALGVTTGVAALVVIGGIVLVLKVK